MLGLYLVLWGKNREKKEETQKQALKEPLLVDGEDTENGVVSQSDIP